MKQSVNVLRSKGYNNALILFQFELSSHILVLPKTESPPYYKTIGLNNSFHKVKNTLVRNSKQFTKYGNNPKNLSN